MNGVRAGLLSVAVVVVALAGATRLAAQTPEETPQATPPDGGVDAAGTPAAEDATRTAGGALRLFMVSRDYRTIRQLKGVMTAGLQTRYDHDSAPFNGKRGNRLAVFDFGEKDLKPVRSPAKGSTAPQGFLATVRSLWEEQGEATEKRVESITVKQQEDGLWRISDLKIATTDKIRFADAVNGVTTLRMVLRAWTRGDAVAARPHLADAFLRRSPARDEAIRSLFAPAEGRRHAAYEIVDMTPQGTTVAVARVRLYETVIGEPGPIDGRAQTLKLERKGSRWILDSWD